MTELGIAQYLRFYDGASTYHRWQRTYIGQTVTWQSAQWQYVEFTASGLIAGTSGDETGITIEVPATRTTRTAFEQALSLGHLVELTQYQYDPFASLQPPAGQVLQAQFVGQVVGASGSLTRLTIELGSALAPVGRSVPPRSLTTLIMGTGCRL